MGLRHGAAATLTLIALAAIGCSSGDTTVDAVLPTVAATTSAVTEPGEDTGTSPSEPVQSPPEESTGPPAQLTGELELTVIDVHPHDPDAFTQGLELHAGRLIEGTGLYGESDRRIVDIESGEIESIEAIDGSLFGEGLTVVGHEVLQLTWKAGVYIRSDVQTLTETGRGVYDGEGWGLCFDGGQLVMSDGTPTLTFRDPQTFEATGTVDVTLNGQLLGNINELECVNGQVLANVWRSDSIVAIDPANGQVVATLNASSLRPSDAPADDSGFALNGIAHDPSTGHFFLTGKRWSVLYEVELS
jgi:glutamine cyclotransferase